MRNLKKNQLLACGITLLFISLQAPAAQVDIERVVDDEGIPRLSADVKVGYKLGTVDDMSAPQDFASVMYWQGVDEPTHEWDNAVFFSVYSNSPAAPVDTTPAYLHCLVGMDSPLYEDAIHLASHANGSTGYRVIAEDPNVTDLISVPKCVALQQSHDNTYGGQPRVEFWYMGGWSGADGEHEYLWANVGPQPLVDGEIVRELSLSTTSTTTGQGQYSIDVVDNTPVPLTRLADSGIDGTFHCTANSGAATDSAYKSLVNSPSKFLMLGVETINNGLTQPCSGLTLEFSTYVLKPLDV
jgi:hypothetical protein